MKIDKLTNDQVAQAEEIKSRWLGHVLSTEPAERELAERGIRLCYQRANLRPPESFVWCPSPRILNYNLKTKLKRGVLGDFSVKLRRISHAAIDKKIREKLRDQISIGILDDGLNSISRGQNSILQRLTLRSNRESDSVLGYGQRDAFWMGFYDYLGRVLGIAEIAEQMVGLTMAMESCAWFYPSESTCWVAERPDIIRLDDQKQLHSDSGPSYAHKDEYKVHSIHGVFVPEYVVECPSNIALPLIKGERNTEVRRVMIERYGAERYLIDAGARTIHSDGWGELYYCEEEDDEPLVMVKVVNSTMETDGSFRNYFIRVPPEITTARAAVAWTFGKTEEEYQPFFQT